MGDPGDGKLQRPELRSQLPDLWRTPWQVRPATDRLPSPPRPPGRARLRPSFQPPEETRQKDEKGGFFHALSAHHQQLELRTAQPSTGTTRVAQGAPACGLGAGNGLQPTARR